MKKKKPKDCRESGNQRRMRRWLEWRLGRGKRMPEIIIVSDAVEGTFVDLNGESGHEQVEAKLLRRGAQ